MNKIKRYFKNILRNLPFGLKGAEREIMGTNDTGEDGTVITQQVTDERVAKHLLKGEVTQEVEELRYRTYKVSNESENFTYVGNGVAFKGEKDEEQLNKTKFHVIQENKIICSTVLKELQHVGDYGTEDYRVEITYNDVVRFKLEQFAHTINVDIDEKEKKFETTLRFWKEADKYNVKSKPFLVELAKAVKLTNEYAISKNEILSSVKTISFNTYKAVGEDDFTTYGFTEGCRFKSASESDSEYSITFAWDDYIRVPLNLEKKYFSKSMEDKYKAKERKNVQFNLKELEKKYFCPVCGGEVDEYSASIQLADGNKPICKDCMKKALKNK